MPREERWQFWHAEMSRCLKCYACRAACPLCYCTKCITENNQPQWVPVASDAFGNLEWNVVRAMHLAGRCIDCGSCAAACPEGIRIDLLNHVLAQAAMDEFAAEPGYSTRKEYALSSFKPDDKEDFIQ
jgi:formate dehydrogenase (coenzyme F420) beta subunit